MKKFVRTLAVSFLVFITIFSIAKDSIRIAPDSIVVNPIEESPDVRPQFQGGESEFYTWFQENFEYPKELKELGLKARVCGSICCK